MWLLPVVLASGGVPRQTPAVPTQSALYSQSVDRTFARDVGSNPDVSYLLLDATSGESLGAQWKNPEEPVPVGSLVKPFIALAYAAGHGFQFPIYECRGKLTECWQPRPHGKLGITEAIAFSCNSYFRSLAENVTAEQLRPITASFRLEFPKPAFTSATLIGLGEQWRIGPQAIARAYLELYRRRDQPGVREVLAGMRLSSERGTGAAIGRVVKHSDAFVKTGTAPCIHTPHAQADGFVVALIPADEPQVLLLLRVHGVAGAKAAEIAAHGLSKIAH